MVVKWSMDVVPMISVILRAINLQTACLTLFLLRGSLKSITGTGIHQIDKSLRNYYCFIIIHYLCTYFSNVTVDLIMHCNNHVQWSCYYWNECGMCCSEIMKIKLHSINTFYNYFWVLVVVLLHIKWLL